MDDFPGLRIGALIRRVMENNMNHKILIILGIVLLVISAGVVLGIDEYDQEPIITEQSETEPVENYDIMRTAREYGTLEMFVTMLQESDLTELLRGQGPFTVFIPDDSAFKALDSKWLKQLLSDHKEIKKLLERHIVTDAAIIFGREESIAVVSLSQDTLYITADAEKVTVNDAEILDEEIECSNGIIHVIDAVLMKP
jgi:uncharacterized surface protein with fasciclin (FAS1) repeats